MVLVDFYNVHPMWSWIAVAAVLLAAEIGTGSGWLLWPAASAGVVALVAFMTRDLGLAGEVAVFAVLTIVTTLLAKKLLPQKTPAPGANINDRAHSLIGKTGTVVTGFAGGEGRVLVDGAEWVAQIEGEAPETGGAVEVIRAIGGARLAVKAA